MAGRRCSLCGITYPNEDRFARCPVHGRYTVFFGSLAPTPDWEEQARRQHEQLDLARTLSRLIPSIVGAVSNRDDRLWLAHRDPRRDGHLELGDLVRVGGQIYEIQGYCRSSREYWVEPFSLNLTDSDLEQLLEAA